MNYILALLSQLVIYLLIMLYDEYFGTLLALILGVIALSIWVLSYVVEWVQRSRVTPQYYRYLLTVWVAPFVALVGFLLLRGGVGWM